MRIVPMGERAVLVTELDADPAAWSSGLRQLALRGVVDVVPAAETVLVNCADESSLSGVLGVLPEVVPFDAVDSRRPTIEIPVRYDGADLGVVAQRSGLDEHDVIAAHAAPTYTVAFCGFAPGFGYLRGLDLRLQLPRRSTPRTRVPAGSVAIAAEFSAVYPRSSPGGWHLLGRTDLVLFDARRDPPSLIEPGTHVRFVPA